MKFYQELPPMECLAGDTLPEFIVKVTTTDESGNTVPADISYQFMTLNIASVKNPTETIVTKQCTRNADNFSVIIDDNDTRLLGKGTFFICFGMSNTSMETYRKLAGVLKVIPAP